MPVVSVDLAYLRYEDIGVCVLRSSGTTIGATFESFPADGSAPEPSTVSHKCIDLCLRHGACLLLLDGPQAWKHPQHGTDFARSCEQVLRAPAKTGLPGHVTPRNYQAFVEFSIAVFDALEESGWPRLQVREPPHGNRPLVIETFPNAAWRALGIPILPAKSKANAPDVVGAVARLQKIFRLDIVGSPTHDSVQALVSGLAGIALECGNMSAYHLAGWPPTKHEDIWREGFIITPLPSPVFGRP